MQHQLTADEAELMSEINSHVGEELLGNEKFIERIVRSNAPLAERILGKIQDLAEAFRTLGNKEARAEYKRLKTAESLFMRAIENAGLVYQGNKIKKAIEQMAREEQENGEVENENEEVDKENGEKPKKITTGMTDDERYQILKNRSISLSAIADNKKMEAAQKRLELSEKDIEFSEYGDRVRLFKKLGTEFSVYQTYRNRDIQLDFRFSKEKMRESVSKQQKNYICFAKMLSCLDDVIDNAIGIEVHNRNEDGYKRDDTLRNVYVLASAFVDGEKIFPVKLEVKEFTDKQNTLHVAIALESIKKDGSVKQEVANAGVARQYSVPSVISIAEYFRKINPSDESFYKYIPKPFLDSKSQFSLNSQRNLNYSEEDERVDERIRKATRNLNPENESQEPKKEKKPATDKTPTADQDASWYANRFMERVYTKKDVSLSVKSVTDKVFQRNGFLDEQSDAFNVILSEIYRAVNTSNETVAREKLLKVADRILQTVKPIRYKNLSAEKEMYDTMHPYLYRLDLSPFKDSIQAHYKNDNSVYLRWSKGKRKGISSGCLFCLSIGDRLSPFAPSIAARVVASSA